MLRDVERGGATEVEHILGFVLDKASEANIARRTLLLAYTHIKLSSSGVPPAVCPDLAQLRHKGTRDGATRMP